MIYCDTALLVAALTPYEAASSAAGNWLGEQAAGTLAVSWWTDTEFASAMAMKVRRGDLRPATQARILAAWATFRELFAWLPVEQRHYRTAAQLILAPDARLRGGDALHLAIALDSGCTLATFDRVLHAAADQYGISAQGIGPAA